MILKEGGNIFKDENGAEQTQRIDQASVAPTVKWLEKLTGIDFTKEKSEVDNMPVKWLGSTGRKTTSGDLDLLVNANEVSKDQLSAALEQWATQQGISADQVHNTKNFRSGWLMKTGNSVHFKTPIAGNPANGFVQTDFMFFNKPLWSQFVLQNDPTSQYKGATRNILINSIAKSMGYKLNQNDGIMDRATNQLISDDSNRVARMLLTPQATAADLYSVERILASLKTDPKRDAKLADFRDHMNREGTPLDENVSFNDVFWLARLRDRIINQGYRALVEAEQAGVGGKAKGIEHLEDLVFRYGTPGIQQALDIVQHAAAAPGETTTVKWDGKPAVIFGRKPDTGEFVLTDGSGFEAKGYDGLFTSPQAITANMAQRDANAAAKSNAATRVKELAPIYTRLWPMLNAALTKDFRGYVKGDLLYMNTPPVEDGRYVFTPNTVTYRIPANSALGKQIGASNVGVAMHTMYADRDAPRAPLQGVNFNPVPGLLLADPSTSVPQSIVPNAKAVAQLQNLVKTDGAKINAVFNPESLRALKITDLARLCVDYVNTKVGQPLTPQTLLPEFGKWLQTKVTASKYNNIAQYLNDPVRNAGLAAAFNAFILLHDIKENIRAQLDAQHPGQEGWVMATPAGYSKAVGRFNPDAFAAQNRARNNPQPA